MMFNFGAIIGAIGKVASVAKGILTTALPFLKALRGSVAEVDVAFNYIETKISQGGDAADDFLDKNLEAVKTVEAVSHRGEATFRQMGVICSKLRVYSQEQTPDTITEEEALDLGREFFELKSTFAKLGPELEAAITELESMKD